MKKYTYLVKYNYFGDNIGGYEEKFITIDHPINSKEQIDSISQYLEFTESVLFTLLSISLMDIQTAD